MVKRKVFIERVRERGRGKQKQNIQRHLEESRAERESRLNMASRLEMARDLCGRSGMAVVEKRKPSENHAEGRGVKKSR